MTQHRHAITVTPEFISQCEALRAEVDRYRKLNPTLFPVFIREKILTQVREAKAQGIPQYITLPLLGISDSTYARWDRWPKVHTRLNHRIKGT